jgi:ElaB/YqjD/DUF883 family membrane-anchored ribosome-binding protein
METLMARDPTTPALAADYDALLAQLTVMREEMTRLAAQMGASATQGGKAMANTINTGLHDAQRYAGHKAHDADVRIGTAVAANPYLALGIAAGLGLLLGALTRR